MAWGFLLVFVTIAIFRAVDAASTCTPEQFGTGINIKDCIQAEDEIYMSLEPDQDYTVTREFSLHNPDRRQRVPQGKTLRTCGIGFDIADPDQQTIKTTVLKLRLNIQALMNDCVSEGGHSGFRLADGLVFVLSNPLVVNGYGTCLATRIPYQPRLPQRLNLLQCMNKHGSDPTFYPGMRAVLDHDPRLAQPDHGVQGRTETRHIRRAALPVSPSNENHGPERYSRPPRPPNDRGRGRGINRGASPNPGGQSPRSRLDQAPPRTYYSGPRTPTGSAYREHSPGSEGSVFYGHGGPGGSRESSPGLDYGQFPPLPPAHGSASIPNVPQGGYLPGFHPQYEAFRSNSEPLSPAFLPVGPIAQGLQGIPGVVDSAHHPAGSAAQESQENLEAPHSGSSHGNFQEAPQAGSQPLSGNAPQGDARPPSAQGVLPVVAHWRPSYSGVIQAGQQNRAPPTQGQAISAPAGQAIQGDLPQGALWVPHHA